MLYNLKTLKQPWLISPLASCKEYLLTVVVDGVFKWELYWQPYMKSSSDWEIYFLRKGRVGVCIRQLLLAEGKYLMQSRLDIFILAII